MPTTTTTQDCILNISDSQKEIKFKITQKLKKLSNTQFDHSPNA